jgi:hypothetical protein
LDPISGLVLHVAGLLMGLRQPAPGLHTSTRRNSHGIAPLWNTYPRFGRGFHRVSVLSAKALAAASFLIDRITTKRVNAPLELGT